MTFLTPLGALAALAALLPVAAWVVGRRHTAAVTRALGLQPSTRRNAIHIIAAAAALALLGLAAAQPAFTHQPGARTRTDAEALFVVDTSRSMAASATPSAPTRLDRALTASERLRGAIAEVPSGIATLTDRVLPDLLPVADVSSFDTVADRGVAIESPPPAASDIRATTFAALGDISSGNYFHAKTTTRLVVLLTDGESNPLDASALANALPRTRGYRFIAVRFWHNDETVYKAGDKPETAYRPDPLGRIVLADVASALGGRAFDEAQLGAALSFLRQAAGTGPTAAAPAATQQRTPLAPYLAALALVLLCAAVIAEKRGYTGAPGDIARSFSRAGDPRRRRRIRNAPQLRGRER